MAQRSFDEPVQVELYLDAKPVSRSPRDQYVDGSRRVERRARLGAVALPHRQHRGAAARAVPGRGRRASTSTTRSPARRNARASNLSLTFDTFVTGKANQLARAAANQVADNPGKSYNPLFLHGGVGLGKTHLIQAVGNQIVSRNPTARIRYIHADQFVADVVRAYQRKAFDKFKRSITRSTCC